MRFLKKNIKVIAGMLIGILLTGGIVFATGQLNASEVTYNTNTVAGALDNLYNYAKNKSDLAEKMQKPNTWSTTEEENFGDGVYGRRYVGTIDWEKSTRVNKNLVTDSSIKIISCGGFCEYYESPRPIPWNLPDANNGTNIASVILNHTGAGIIQLCVYTAEGLYANQNYDVWFLYTKQ